MATALQPVGTTLYIYGGGWDWQDDLSAHQTTTIGVADEWVSFFNTKDANYNYKFVAGTGNQETDPPHSYYPFGSWNQYYYAGLDCSGYLGWTIYNVANTTSTTDRSKGYVGASTSFAKRLCETYGYGTFSQEAILPANPLRCGDIVSIKGHVWVCVGTCGDGSAVILHCTPSESRQGEQGGGVQLSSINPSATAATSEARQLAEHYMTKYYPEWSRRYPVVEKPYGQYTDITSDNRTGRFTWLTDGTFLTDPDGYATMSAAEILADLFGE